ncbi:MAG: PilZ domain-containing protein [Candidatus Omnitrophica bacterium]|nr:PilZ domain-containing protein [Candidatus Omnitrophota bacterium]MBU4589473.1 PilZ domain-containing protein [Candidatus Omnitrophota bacterium]
MIQERRKHHRAKTNLPLKIADKAFDIITETADISSSGIYCRVTRLLPLMSKIEVILLMPAKGNGRQAKKIRCRGVVVRSEPIILEDTEKAHYNVAIFFNDISKKDQKIIDGYLGSEDTENKIETEIQTLN